MKTAKELENMFFRELKQYNSTNFKTLLTADLSADDAKAHKSFSSVITTSSALIVCGHSPK